MLKIYGKSIQGRRKANQDSIYFDSTNDSFIMVVADGVGGNYGGAEASKIATDCCAGLFRKFSANPKIIDLKSFINQIYDCAQEKIQNYAYSHLKYQNMATTLTLVLGYRDQYVVGNIGDSRTYLIMEKEGKQISRDHSYLEEYKEKYQQQEIDPYFESHLRHIITRSLNAQKETIDIYPKSGEAYQLGKEELLLLCSDGFIPDKILTEDSPVFDKEKDQELVEKLVELAYEKGSKDNISVIIGYNDEGE